jgi:hypothetical protein
MQEHASLQEKMKYAVEDLHRTEILFIGAMALYYAWLFKEGVSAPAVGWLFFIPCLVAVVGFVRSLARVTYIGRLEAYIRRIEEHFGLSGNLGWEHHYSSHAHGWHYNSVRLAIWVFSFVVALVLALAVDTSALVRAS